MRRLFFVASILLVWMGGITGCKMAGSANGSDSLAVDSFKYAFADSMLHCNIVADVPQGDDSLAVGVRAYVNAQLDSLSSVHAFDASRSAGYGGDLTDGQALVDFYGKLNVDSMRAMQSPDGGAPEFQCSYDVAIRLAAQNERYVTYSVDQYVYGGGAHGSSVSYCVNILKSSGRVLGATVDAAQLEAIQPLLLHGVTTYINAQGQKVTEDEALRLLFIDKGIIPLPAHAPYLAADGLHFVYQQYEIGPYAMGMVSFTLPYDKVKPYMTAEALQLLETGAADAAK